MTEPEQALSVVRRPSDARLAMAALVKRTYAWSPSGLHPADEQDPIVEEPELGEAPGIILLDDSDLVAPKLATDVVVVRALISPPKPTPRTPFGIAVAEHARTLEALGPRHARVGADGGVSFSEPEPFERLELGYGQAYGGYDAFAHDLLDPPDEETAMLMQALADGRIEDDGEFPVRAKGLFAYPRNPAGVGYYIDVERPRADGAALPRIEDPSDPLTPERLFVATPLGWMDGPLAAGLGWIQHSWYPRLVRFVGPIIDCDDGAKPREALFPDGDDLVAMARRDPERIFPRALQGAAPGVAVRRLRGDEPIELSNLHPEHARLRMLLPGEAPRVALRPAGLASLEPEAVLQTVRIDCEALRVSLTWCAIVPLAGNVDDAFLQSTELEVRMRSL